MDAATGAATAGASAADGHDGRGVDAPLRAETEAMLDAVNALRLDDLRALVDDDYGIVDVDPDGDAVVIDTREAWDAYMERSFAAMRAADARLAYEILDYAGREGADLAYSVVRFQQEVGVGEGADAVVRRHTCVATIVWKRTPDGWREARWHCTREGTGDATDGGATDGRTG